MTDNTKHQQTLQDILTQVGEMGDEPLDVALMRAGAVLGIAKVLSHLHDLAFNGPVHDLLMAISGIGMATQELLPEATKAVCDAFEAPPPPR